MMTLTEQLAARSDARGHAKALLKVLAARGLAVSASEHERIFACADLELLDRWLARSVVATSTTEVLADH